MIFLLTAQPKFKPRNATATNATNTTKPGNESASEDGPGDQAKDKDTGSSSKADDATGQDDTDKTTRRDEGAGEDENEDLQGESEQVPQASS